MKEKVVVFGKGRYFKKKQKSLLDKYEIVGFVDNAVKENGCGFEGEYIVYNPVKIRQFSKDTKIVLMSVKYMEMWKQLLDLGIEEDRIVLGLCIEPYNDECERILNEKGFSACIKDGKLCLRIDNKEYEFENDREYKNFLWGCYRDKFGMIKEIADMPLNPISRRFGQERGTAIDRIYIEQFLEKNKRYICGDVLEIGDNTYTKKFGGNNINKASVLHVNGWGEHVIKGNLATGEGITDNMVDCFICTQTLIMIYDIHNSIKNIHGMLKKGGTVLITCSAIAQLSMYDYENWGEYWRVTEQSLRKLLEEYFTTENIQVLSYGNVKTAVGLLYGLCAEDLKPQDFEYNDVQYPLIIAAVARKE